MCIEIYKCNIKTPMEIKYLVLSINIKNNKLQFDTSDVIQHVEYRKKTIGFHLFKIT